MSTPGCTNQKVVYLHYAWECPSSLVPNLLNLGNKFMSGGGTWLKPVNFSLMEQIWFSFKSTFSFSIANFTVTCLSVSHSRRDISTFLNNLTMKTICFLNVILHWREEGCIGNYAPRGPRDLPKYWFCTPRPERLPEGEARGQSRGPRGAKSMLRQISRSEGGVISNGSRLSSV